MPDPTTTRSQQPDAITGVQALQGEGVQEAKGFWADAWSYVIRRPGAIAALIWISFVGLMAVFAPIIASGHPLILETLNDAGEVTSISSPLIEHLTPTDWFLMIGTILSLIWIVIPISGRGHRLGIIVAGALQGGLTIVLVALLKKLATDNDAPVWAKSLVADGLASVSGPVVIASAAALGVAALFVCLVPTCRNPAARALAALIPAGVAALAASLAWTTALPTFAYQSLERDGTIHATYTLVPWSPAQRFGDRNTKTLPPGTTSDQALQLNITFDLNPINPIPAARLPELLERAEDMPLSAAMRESIAGAIETAFARPTSPTGNQLRTDIEAVLADSGRPYTLGTDESGQDVLSQLIHASRLALSVGFVATSIAVLIGITMGALMGYFGGVVDLLLYRVVEIFMSIPVLVILIVAAGVLPRNLYVMMGIIGCFTWQTAARFTRAEFFKLRNQDFVQSAQAMGLPLRSILFKHMLPNGVTPVLVDASFLIAFAILYESIISYLGLGPPDQASWGKLLADATGENAEFVWWLAIFPGLVIFLTVLAYNLLGEALRDAIDPKLKKARV